MDSPDTCSAHTYTKFVDTLVNSTRFLAFRDLATLFYSDGNIGSSSMVSSIEFDKDRELFAVAGVTKRSRSAFNYIALYLFFSLSLSLPFFFSLPPLLSLISSPSLVLLLTPLCCLLYPHFLLPSLLRYLIMPWLLTSH